MHNNFNQKNSLSEQNLRSYVKILSWAHLNFELQSLLQKGEQSTILQKQLDEVGYLGEIPSDTYLLFQEDGFFSYQQTSQRIVSFTLKEIGLKKELFAQAEEGIRNAYEAVKEGKSTLLSKSLTRTLQTLCVFKP